MSSNLNLIYSISSMLGVISDEINVDNIWDSTFFLVNSKKNLLEFTPFEK